MNRNKFLESIKQRLEVAFGERFDALILYCSFARDTAAEDSDIDILILLKGKIDLWDDNKVAIHAIYDLQLETIHPIHTIPINVNEFNAGDFALYRNVKQEGIVL